MTADTGRDLVDIWPLFGLELHTPRLVLTPVRDEHLPALVHLARAGIHEPDRMPFGFPWTLLPDDEMRRGLAQYHWGVRAGVRPGNWAIEFAVLAQGAVIGVQALNGHDFTVRKTVTTGSWLGKSHQRHGYGTEMRAAVLCLAFDHLDAEIAESGAVTWNTASLRVSEKLGYTHNGLTRHAVKEELIEEQLVRLHRDDFARPGWPVRVEGLAASLGELLPSSA
ncbi:MAG TPA: GNAT family N-acetyltransferase [Naasia sp.]|jgi:RimJ/RimL family protein N-acetyltransferase